MKSKFSKLLMRFKLASMYGVSKSINALVQLLISYLIIKQHSVSLWGEYVELFLWVNLIAVFSYFGNKSFLLKKISQNPAQLFQLWYTNFCSRLLLFILPALILLGAPLFKEYRVLALLWTTLLFYNQSFEVIVLYNRQFKISTLIEAIGGIFILFGVLFSQTVLNLDLFLYIIIGGNFLKALFYSTFYLKHFKGLTFNISTAEIWHSVPFFAPVLLGTIRAKVDAYYGTVFFSKVTLSKYQIFISILGLVQMGFFKKFLPNKTLCYSKN